MRTILDRILREQEAADRIGTSRRGLQRMCRAGQGPVKVRISPGRVGFRESDVAAWIAARPAKGW